jgi:hypothetical protein
MPTDVLDLPSEVAGLAISLAFVVGIVMALVEFSKQLGNHGRGCLILGIVAGLVLGAGLSGAALGAPRTFHDWFLLVIVALICGLSPSGSYNLLFRDHQPGAQGG